MKMENGLSRRRFLRTTATAVALSAVAPASFAALGQAKPRRVGVIGTGWYGKNDVFRLIQVEPVEVVAICDVDTDLLTEAAELISQRQLSGNRPQTYGDYRKLLADHKLDIVIVGTPDHWHALQTIDAIKAGAHVYCQKPISKDVMEGEAMLSVARAYNKVVQIGTQRRSTPHLIEAKHEIVDKGLLGKIHHAEMCCYFHMRANGNPEVQAVPGHLDYDMWTGPAPLRPYDGIPHIRWWRTFMEYGNGIMGDMCVHMLDTTRWIMGLGWPKRISSFGGIFLDKSGKSNIADTQSAWFEYDELNLVWQHRAWGNPADEDYPWSCIIYGDKGKLKLSTMQYDFVPYDKDVQPIHKDVVYEDEKYPEEKNEKRIERNAAPATRLHMLDFLNAIDHNKRPIADIEEGHISTASCILANISMQLGRPLVYDPEKRKVVGDREATKMLQKPYRSPYQHPGKRL
ncbi:MAG: Gfo/Idh/MocA family oxidoreductase [Saprospiraceae bacterium]|nr:Gfo/Idh/MocA family oxidoreductase [Saprospiraceae bacterium]